MYPAGRIAYALFMLGLVLLSLPFVALAGCNADLDALYADEDALIALLPARPDDPVAPACGMCAKQNCEQQRLDCEQDALCSQLLACKAPCDNPACLFECEADFEARGEHNNFHTCWYYSDCTSDESCADECLAEHDASDAYDVYRTCVFDSECKDECATGENWQCLGDYSWKPGDERFAADPRLTVMVKDIDLLTRPYSGIEGVEVYACAAYVSNVCTDEPQAISDGQGIAALERLQLEDDGTYQGHLRFVLHKSDDQGIEQTHAIGRPIHRQLTMEQVVMPKDDWLGKIEELMTIAPDRAAGHVSAVVHDCLNAPAPGIAFSLASDQTGTVYYGVDSDEQAPGTETNETGTGGIGNVNLLLVNPNKITDRIRAVRSDDGSLVSELWVVIWPDALTRVDLYPLARDGNSSAP